MLVRAKPNTSLEGLRILRTSIRFVVLAIFFLAIGHCGSRADSVSIGRPALVIAVDSPYWNKQWRDSAIEYHQRLVRYRGTLLGYDNTFLLSLLPFAAEAGATGNVAKGALFFFARVAGGGAALTGALGLIKDQGSSLKNVVLTILGVAGYIFFKITEINDVQHDVSIHNEDAVAENHIALDDVEPGSIRYPERSWPNWVTAAPPTRKPLPASDVFRTPEGAEHFRTEFQFRF